MTDIIEKALDDWQDEQEREATGTIDGHNVTLKKKEYEVEQLGPTAWKIAVYIDQNDYPAEQSKNLEANEAQEEFMSLVSKHDLDER